MARRCAEEWQPVLLSKGILPDWPTTYPIRTDLMKKTADGDFDGDFDEDEILEDEGLDIEESCSDVGEEDDDEDLYFEYDD